MTRQQELVQTFEHLYGGGGNIRLFFAPGRVNLIGDHTDYNGGHTCPCALKLGFTALAIGGGFKGGEIVPTLSIGACFGALFGSLTGYPVPLGAACGMIALFAGATNCPIAALLIAMEMFHGVGLPFFTITVAMSFILSGYYSLYGSQRFVYSKTKHEERTQ